MNSYWTGILFNQETNKYDLRNGKEFPVSSEIEGDNKERRLCVVARITERKTLEYKSSTCCDVKMPFVCKDLQNGKRTNGIYFYYKLNAPCIHTPGP